MAHEPERVRALELALELSARNKNYAATGIEKETTAKQIVKDAKTFLKFLNNVNEPDTEAVPEDAKKVSIQINWEFLEDPDTYGNSEVVPQLNVSWER